MPNIEPLEGIRVLELGSMAAGPFCGKLLGDFGAEVIKVEQPEGDPGRFLGEHHQGVSLQAKSIMRNKKNVCLDMRTSKGQELVRKLVAVSDVVIENFRPGTLEKWQLGYSELKNINPRLVMARISGYGQSGPYSNLPGYGATCEALSGLRHMTGDPDRPPARAALPLTDFLSGLYAAFGVLMALRHAESTGRGQEIDLALYEASFTFMHAFVPTFDKTGKIGNRAGSRLPNMTPNNLYMTKDEKYFLIAAGSQSMFRRLAKVMTRDDLVNDSRFENQASRARNEDELDWIIGEWTKRHTSSELQTMLQEAGVACGPVYNIADIFRDRHFAARQMLVKVPDEDFEEITLAGIVPKLSDTPGSIKWSGTRQGSHTRTVLTSLLGLDDAQVQELSDEHIIELANVSVPSESRTG